MVVSCCEMSSTTIRQIQLSLICVVHTHATHSCNSWRIIAGTSVGREAKSFQGFTMAIVTMASPTSLFVLMYQLSSATHHHNLISKPNAIAAMSVAAN